MKIVTILGARPQFIKAAAVSRHLRAVAEEVIVHTGQHYDANMSDVFFEELDLPAPDHHLGVGGGTHGAMTGAMLAKVEEVLLQERPDWVLVYGDTNSTLAGALAAVKLQIPVAHVEAGLRSFNRRMPEEINRIMTDHASEVLFAPTETAVRHLANEGIRRGVHLVGDVMLDATRLFRERAERRKGLFESLRLEPGEYYLATVHRAENTAHPERLEQIFQAFQELDRPVLLPLHPRTRKQLEAAGRSEMLRHRNLNVIEPVGYLEMLLLESHARAILTDSGGLQKEAYFLGVPCVTLRDETEWVETVASGWNSLVGADARAIVEAVATPRSREPEPSGYGEGDASQKIARILCGEPRVVAEPPLPEAHAASPESEKSS